MAQLSDFITITQLPRAIDVQTDLAAGKLFQYQKSDGDNYVFNNHQPMYYSAYLTYPAGVVRGNHYHQRKEENLLVLTGEIKLKCWLPKEPDDVAEYTLAPGQIVNLQPGIAHACVSERGATAIEFCPQPLDIADSFPV